MSKKTEIIIFTSMLCINIAGMCLCWVARDFWVFMLNLAVAIYNGLYLLKLLVENP
jgi:hypothetical protein